MTDKPRFTILLIDDSPEILDSLSALLSPRHKILAARSGLAGLDLASRRPQPHLILLDVMMPEVDGYAVLARLKENPLTRSIPVVLLTSLTDPESEEHAFELGASDFISKPIQPNVVKARVRVQLEARQAREALSARKDLLEIDLQRLQTADLTQNSAVRVLAQLAELRDNGQSGHGQRVQRFVWLLAEILRARPRFRDILTPDYIDLLAQAAPLHDLGKFGLPDRVFANAPLGADDCALMKTHVTLGAEMIERIERDSERPTPFLSMMKEIMRSHHERWDGGGYPDGLAGEAIPAPARIVALADAFDALISSRPGKPAVPPDAARDMIARGRALRFDPDVTDAFLENFEEFLEIIEKHASCPA